MRWSKASRWMLNQIILPVIRVPSARRTIALVRRCSGKSTSNCPTMLSTRKLLLAYKKAQVRRRIGNAHGLWALPRRPPAPSISRQRPRGAHVATPRGAAAPLLLQRRMGYSSASRGLRSDALGTAGVAGLGGTLLGARH